MAKKKKILTIEQLIEQALVPESEWPYQIPDDWVWVHIETLGTIQTGNTPSKKNSKFYNGEYPFFKPIDLKQGYFVYNAKDSLTKLGLENARVVPKNSIMVTCIGATIGKTGFSRRIGATNQQINFIIPNDNFSAEYIYFYVISSFFQKEIKTHSSSTTLPILNKSRFKNLVFPLPPLETQKQIVKKLESMLSKIKKAKDLIKEAKESFKNRKAAILHKAFTGELTKKWRETNSKTPEMLESQTVMEMLQGIIDDREEFNKGKKGREKVKGAKTVEEMLVPESEQPYQIPEGWVWVRLGDVLDKLTDGSHFSPKIVREGIPYITVKDLKDSKINFDNSKKILKKDYLELKKNGCRPKFGDILFSKDGTVGKTSVINYKKEFVVLSSLAILRPNNIYLDSYFIEYLLKSPQILSQAINLKTGTAIRRIVLKHLKLLKIPLPPISEQKQIVKTLETLLEKEEQALSLLNIEKDLELLEKSILAKAFRGELTANIEINNKETAMDLLVRVLKEKNNFPPKKNKDGRLF